MPSFCCPLDNGPWPAITRPLAGQRNFGNEPAASADLAPSFGVSATGVNTLALAAVSVSDGAATTGADLACANAGAALGCGPSGLPCEVRTPGMTSRSPTLSLASTVSLLALAISPTGLP